ncbi:MAG: hypothetical protein ACLQOO_29160 [Terriglobia bacterium]
MLKLGEFIVFLVLFILWIYTATRFFRTFVFSSYGELLWKSELMLLWFLSGFFAFSYCLTRFISLEFMLLMIAGSHAGALFLALVMGLLGLDATETYQRLSCAGVEVTKRHTVLGAISGLIPLVVPFIIYPVLMTVLYFVHRLPSARLTILIIEWSVILLFFSCYLTLLMTQTGVLVARDLDEDTRKVQFVSILSQVVTIAFYVEVLLLLVHTMESGEAFTLAGFALVVSYKLVAALVCIFVLWTVLYVAGFQRSKRWKKNLLAKEKEWLDQLRGWLSAPAAGQYELRLAQAERDLDGEMQETRTEPGMTYALWTQEPVTPEEEKQLADKTNPMAAFRARTEQNFKEKLAPFFKAVLPTHPGQRHLDFIESLRQDVTEAASAIKGSATSEEKISVAKRWADTFQDRRLDLDARIGELNQTSMPKWIFGGGLAATVLSTALESLAKEAIQVLLRSVHH